MPTTDVTPSHTLRELYSDDFLDTASHVASVWELQGRPTFDARDAIGFATRPGQITTD